MDAANHPEGPTSTPRRGNLAGLGVEACQATSGAGGEPPGDDAAAPGATEVPVTLDDYSFGVEPTLRAGLTAFSLDNVGGEEHEMVLFELVEGATVDDALAAEQAGGPGAVLCRTARGGCGRGMPHVAQGMVTSVEVTG